MGNQVLTWANDINGGLKAVDLNGNVAFKIAPSVNSDGSLDYNFTLVGNIDPKISNTFSLSNLANRNYFTQNDDYPELTSNGVTLRMVGYEDNDGANDSINNTTRVAVSVSTQGIGVSSNSIDNKTIAKNSDADGEKLALEFTASVRGIGIKFDQLDNTERAIWKAFNTSNQLVDSGYILGSSIGGSNAADQFVNIISIFDFTRLEFTAAENTSYSIRAGSDIVTYQNETLSLNFNASVTDSDGDVASSTNFTVTLDGVLPTDNTLIGGNQNEVIQGGTNSETITGNGGADILSGDGGIDTFMFNAGDSTPVISGSGSSMTLAGYDVIKDYSVSSSSGGRELLDLPLTTLATNINNFDGANSVNWGNVTDVIGLHSVNRGEVSFFNSSGTAVSIDSGAKLAAAVDYLEKNLTSGQTVEFSSTSNNTYVFQKGASTGNSTFIELTGLSDSQVTGIEIGGNTDGYIHIT